MVEFITEKDLEITLTTQGNIAIPFVKSSRDASAGTFYMIMEFPDAANISSGKEIDSISLMTTRELTVSSGLRRILRS